MRKWPEKPLKTASGVLVAREKPHQAPNPLLVLSLPIRDVYKLVDHFKSFWLVIACTKEGTKCSSTILFTHKSQTNSTPLLILVTAQAILWIWGRMWQFKKELSSPPTVGLMRKMSFDTELYRQICPPCFYEVTKRVL